jgi:hypothetical protein
VLVAQFIREDLEKPLLWLHELIKRWIKPATSVGEFWMDHYEMGGRMALSYAFGFSGLIFVFRFRIQFQEQAPALTIYQVHILLCIILSSIVSDIQSAISGCMSFALKLYRTRVNSIY